MKLSSVLVALALSLSVVGCSSSGDESGGGGGAPAGSSSGGDAAAPASGDCTFVTEADLASVASMTTTRVARDPMIGAGSTCNGNFAVTVGGQPQMVLLVERLTRAEFDGPTSMMTSTYPVVEQPADLGAEAKLFLTASGDAGAKILWLAKGDRGVQLVTFFATDDGQLLTKAQLLELGKLVAPRF